MTSIRKAALAVPMRLASLALDRLRWALLAALEVHEEPLDVAAIRSDMRQAQMTELIEWREQNIDVADMDSDFAHWETEVKAS